MLAQELWLLCWIDYVIWNRWQMRATVKEVATFFPTVIIKGFSPLLFVVNFVLSFQISYTYILFLDWVGNTSSIPWIHSISGFDRKIKFLEMLCFSDAWATNGCLLIQKFCACCRVYEFVQLVELYYAGSHGMDSHENRCSA